MFHFFPLTLRIDINCLRERAREKAQRSYMSLYKRFWKCKMVDILENHINVKSSTITSVTFKESSCSLGTSSNEIKVHWQMPQTCLCAKAWAVRFELTAHAVFRNLTMLRGPISGTLNTHGPRLHEWRRTCVLTYLSGELFVAPRKRPVAPNEATMIPVEKPGTTYTPFATAGSPA